MKQKIKNISVFVLSLLLFCGIGNAFSTPGEASSLPITQVKVGGMRSGGVRSTSTPKTSIPKVKGTIVSPKKSSSTKSSQKKTGRTKTTTNTRYRSYGLHPGAFFRGFISGMMWRRIVFGGGTILAILVIVFFIFWLRRR